MNNGPPFYKRLPFCYDWAQITFKIEKQLSSVSFAQSIKCLTSRTILSAFFPSSLSLPFSPLAYYLNMRSLFFIFAAITIFVTLINAQQSINGIKLPRESFEGFSNLANRRDLDANGVPTPPKGSPTFQWPRIDGPPENFPPLKDLK